MVLPHRLAAAAAGLLAVVLLPVPALATQGHGAPEGIYVHQFAHLFFTLSMSILIYWLRESELTAQTGWRRIQYAAFFLILWNLDAFLVHALEEQWTLVSVHRIDTWRMHIAAPPPSPWIAGIYYAAKLDHLLCVPALMFLYSGLRHLLADASSQRPEGGGAS